MCNGWLYTIGLTCVCKVGLLVLFVHLGDTATPLHAMGRDIYPLPENRVAVNVQL